MSAMFRFKIWKLTVLNSRIKFRMDFAKCRKLRECKKRNWAKWGEAINYARYEENLKPWKILMKRRWKNNTHGKMSLLLPALFYANHHLEKFKNRSFFSSRPHFLFILFIFSCGIFTFCFWRVWHNNILYFKVQYYTYIHTYKTVPFIPTLPAILLR